MIKDNTTTSDYPKTLLIRNTVGGMIWQIYHVNNIHEADRLADNATKNGFYGISLEEHMPDSEETFPDWRIVGKELVELALIDAKNESHLNALENMSPEQ
jgi:hypothetical protein